MQRHQLSMEAPQVVHYALHTPHHARHSTGSSSENNYCAMCSHGDGIVEQTSAAVSMEAFAGCLPAAFLASYVVV